MFWGSWGSYDQSLFLLACGAQHNDLFVTKVAFFRLSLSQRNQSSAQYASSKSG